MLDFIVYDITASVSHPTPPTVCIIPPSPPDHGTIQNTEGLCKLLQYLAKIVYL